jgi:hypothetical protein
VPSILDNGSRRASRLLPDLVRRLLRRHSKPERAEHERELMEDAERRAGETPVGEDASRGHLSADD